MILQSSVGFESTLLSKCFRASCTVLVRHNTHVTLKHYLNTKILFWETMHKSKQLFWIIKLIESQMENNMILLQFPWPICFSCHLSIWIWSQLWASCCFDNGASQGQLGASWGQLRPSCHPNWGHLSTTYTKGQYWQIKWKISDTIRISKKIKNEHNLRKIRFS